MKAGPAVIRAPTRRRRRIARAEDAAARRANPHGSTGGEPMAVAVQPTSKFLTVNDLRVHYLEWGEAAAPPVVCVHGYTSSAQAFNALARRFQDRFHLMVPDVRGHGESAWSPAGEYDYQDQSGDLAAFVDALALTRFTLIGTSMGGVIAMTYAIAHGERLLNDLDL